jgi:glycosyltransferase involved in cell wall biosynthesis
MMVPSPAPAPVPELTMVVLTFNEEEHIVRCIESATGVASRVVVIDSGSTDRTCDLASALGADILVHPFTNHADQFNWGLDHAAITTPWVLRLDADEYLVEGFAGKVLPALAQLGTDADGITLNRRLIFQGRWLRHGSLYPVRVLRLWRIGRGRLEQRLMDEHVTVQGRVIHVEADFADRNLKSLTWWTEKHNGYASREAVELLNLEYQFLAGRSTAPLQVGSQASAKRWMKEAVYARLPGGLRALAYFFYRYVLRFGFLDGKEGLTFHALQGLWYRYLVDAKLAELREYMTEHGVGPVSAIERVLGVNGLAVRSGFAGDRTAVSNDADGSAAPDG